MLKQTLAAQLGADATRAGIAFASDDVTSCYCKPLTTCRLCAMLPRLYCAAKPVVCLSALSRCSRRIALVNYEFSLEFSLAVWPRRFPTCVRGCRNQLVPLASVWWRWIKGSKVRSVLSLKQPLRPSLASKSTTKKGSWTLASSDAYWGHKNKFCSIFLDIHFSCCEAQVKESELTTTTTTAIVTATFRKKSFVYNHRTWCIRPVRLSHRLLLLQN